MPPPMIAIRGGCWALVTRRRTFRFFREDASEWTAQMRPKSQASSLPDVAAGIPGPVRAGVRPKAPFEPESEGEVMLRCDAAVAESKLVGKLGPPGQIP